MRSAYGVCVRVRARAAASFGLLKQMVGFHHTRLGDLQLHMFLQHYMATQSRRRLETSTP